MAGFDSGVNPPGGMSYAAPLMQFQQFANWAADDPYELSRKKQEQQLNEQRLQQGQTGLDLSNLLRAGGALDAKGNFDTQKAAAILARFNPSAAAEMLQQTPAPLSSMFGGGAQPAPSGQPASIPARPLPPPAANSPQGDAGSGTIASIVTDRLPNQDTTTGQTIAKIASVMGVDPNSTLSPGQQRRAQGLLARYAPQAAGATADASPSFASRFAAATDGGEPALPPSANAVSPRPQAQQPQGAPGGAGSPQAQPTAPAQQSAQPTSNLQAADASLRLTPQEKALYRRHLTNLSGSGGVDNPDGSRSTLKDITVESDGKTYVIPTVYGGKIVSNDEAWKRAKTHLKDFPSYANEAEASARYGAMHQFMEKDTGQFLAARGNVIPAQQPPQPQPVAPAQSPQGAPAAPVAQPQPPQGPITPQVPLPQGFTDPQKAILALRAEAARLSGIPRAAGQARELDNWAERIEKSIQPVPMHPGTTLLAPRTGQPIYQGNQPTMSPEAVNDAAERYLKTGQFPPNMGRGVQGTADRNAILETAHQLANMRGINTAELPQQWQQFKSQQIGIQRFTSGPQGNTVRSFNVLVDHLDTLSEAASALKNGNIQIFNRARQNWAKQTGDPAPTNFDGVKALVGDEIVKAVVGSAGALADREEVKKDLDKASSPKQLSELVDRYRKLALGQLRGLRKQYETATGLKNFGDMLLPGTLAALGGNKGEGSAPDAEGWVTLPNGARIREKKANE